MFLRPLCSGWFVLALLGLGEFEDVETKTVTVRTDSVVTDPAMWLCQCGPQDGLVLGRRNT